MPPDAGERLAADAVVIGTGAGGGPAAAALAEAGLEVIALEAGPRFVTKRRILGGIRAMALLGFYAAPEARALTGYPVGSPNPAAGIADAMTYPVGE